jgi:hypothetical protein
MDVINDSMICSNSGIEFGYGFELVSMQSKTQLWYDRVTLLIIVSSAL